MNAVTIEEDRQTFQSSTPDFVTSDANPGLDAVGRPMYEA